MQQSSCYRTAVKSALHLTSVAVLALTAQVALAQPSSKVFSTAGSWIIARTAPHHCMAVTGGPGNTLGLSTDGQTIFLVLSNGKFEIPEGTYPIGLKMIDYSVTRPGTVKHGNSHAIGVAMTRDDLMVFQRTGWVQVDLGPHSHFFNLTGNETVIRMLLVCETAERDPFATAR